MIHRPTPAQPAFPDLLLDAQEHALARIQAGILQAHNVIQRVNALIIENKLRLKTISAPELGMVYGETENMASMHMSAEKQLRRSCNAPERIAA